MAVRDRDASFFWLFEDTYAISASAYLWQDNAKLAAIMDMDAGNVGMRRNLNVLPDRIADWSVVRPLLDPSADGLDYELPDRWHAVKYLFGL